MRPSLFDMQVVYMGLLKKTPFQGGCSEACLGE